MSFQADAILAALHRHDVKFVLIGGFAANVHGSPLPTSDIDITPQAQAANLDRLSAALTELAKIRAEGTEPLAFAHDAASLAAAGTWNLTPRFGDLDIALTPAGTRRYEDLRQDAVEVQIKGVPVLSPRWPKSSVARTPPGATRTAEHCPCCASCWPARPAAGLARRAEHGPPPAG